MKEFPDEVGMHFCLEGSPVSSIPQGNGNVNDTFLLSCEKDGRLNRYTVQRINHDVFKDPEGLMENFSRVTEHLRNKLSSKSSPRQSLHLVPAIDGRSFVRDSGGNYWRAMNFIDGSESLDVPQNTRQAYEAAKAFGEFQANLSDLPGDPLVETIPDFHNTRKRFEHFCTVVDKDTASRLSRVRDLVEFAMQREDLADAINSKDFPIRVVHNDTKLNNVLLDKDSGESVCVVDLDTVMPGCALHDFGDLVRTAACSAAEDEPAVERIRFLPTTFEAIVEGYLDAVSDFLEPIEVEHLSIAPKVITYELGLRFLADYLEGDIYFKVKHSSHNQERARAQFRLLNSMEDHGEDMRNIVERFSGKMA